MVNIQVAAGSPRGVELCCLAPDRDHHVLCAFFGGGGICARFHQIGFLRAARNAHTARANAVLSCASATRAQDHAPICLLFPPTLPSPSPHDPSNRLRFACTIGGRWGLSETPQQGENCRNILSLGFTRNEASVRHQKYVHTLTKECILDFDPGFPPSVNTLHLPDRGYSITVKQQSEGTHF